MNIKQELMELSDETYAKFIKRTTPHTQYEIIGVRLPQLRQVAKTILKEPNFNINDFLLKITSSGELKVKGDTVSREQTTESKLYFEDVMLTGFIIGYSKLSLDEKLEKIKWFIPRIDNWAICDSFIATLKFKEKDLEKVWKFILSYTKSDKEFEIRFAVSTMIDNFIIDNYVDEAIEILDKIKHEGYYVKMAVAWCMAEVGIKFNDKFMQYIAVSNLDQWTYNKTLQKLVESNRITDEQKKLFKSMKKKD